MPRFWNQERDGEVQHNLKEKIKESLAAVLPITVIVFVLTITIVPATGEMFFLFFVGAIFLILGTGLFTLGADQSMIIIGEEIGSKITRLKKVWLIVPIIFIIGVLITVAEPDLKVLAEQAPIVESNVLIWSVGVGVGVFLVVAFMRIFLQIKISHIFIIMYVIIFAVVLSPLTPREFIPISFDSGGVTTGPITVPFIMALGLGLASVRGDKTQQEDSFGLVALCSIGPIATVLILGMFNNVDGVNAELIKIEDYQNISEVFRQFIIMLPHYFKEVAMAIIPIVAFFLVFNFLLLKLDKKTIFKIMIGLIYTYLGLVLFLTGANVGFMPIGQYLGEQLALSTQPWILIPIGMLIGYFIVSAEPAVHVLKQQVESITEGSITGKSLGISLAIGVAVSVGLSMVRVITGVSILWFLIPGYLFALIMTFFVPALFTSVAFDSGGVASGPMTATFLLPLAMGACTGMGGNMTTDAFGVVAMVAMTPLITIQLLGLISLIKEKRGITKPTDTVISDVTLDEVIITDEALNIDSQQDSLTDESNDDVVLFDL